MYCSRCKMMTFACTCGVRPAGLPPVSLTGGNFTGNITPSTGVISAPGQPFHGLRATATGGVPGTDMWIGPGGLITRGPFTPR